MSQIKRFSENFELNSIILEKNLLGNNGEKDIENRGYSKSVSIAIVEDNLKNISVYFTEGYDKIKKEFENM